MEQFKQAGDGWGDNSQPEPPRDDIERRREVVVAGREWILQARDPHGFWWIMLPGGGTRPRALSGAYTGLWEADRAIKEYMVQHPASPAKAEALEKGTKPPKLRTKKVPAKKLETPHAQTRTSATEEEALGHQG